LCFEQITIEETDMKKNIALLLCAGLSLTLFACGGNNSKSSSAANTTSVENNSKTSKGTASQSASSTGNNSSNKINGSNSTGSESSGTASNGSETGSTDTTGSTSENDISGVKVTDLMGKICKDTKAPANEIFELDKKSFELYSFIKWTNGIEAACSEGQISTDAHSLVLIRANGADTKAIAEDIAAKADPRKWICVGAEVGKVLYTDKYVLMVMTYKDAYEEIKSNFEKLVGVEVQTIDMKKSGNLE
jgi:hypothetical protein